MSESLILVVMLGGLLLVAVLWLVSRKVSAAGQLLGLAVAAALGSAGLGAYWLIFGSGPGAVAEAVLIAAGVVGLSVAASAVWLRGGPRP